MGKTVEMEPSRSGTETFNETPNDVASPTPISTPIQEFYTAAKVLVTGATGFIGKALVEKLLRSCEDIDTVYYLVRTKRGVPVHERHEKLLKSSVFDKIRNERPEALKKMVPLSGDVSEVDLGLSPQDREMLSQEVNVIFHSAATVRFNEKIQDAFVLNTAATIKILDLCKSCRHLKALVHVSTAYSNSDKSEIMEEVYPAPAELERVLEICKIQEEKEQDASVKVIQGNHPNTYTVTKALAESIVNQHAADIPVCIVRPSIVTGAWQEPMPGWVDNFSGISGIMTEIGRGTLKSIVCDETKVMDVIPVDIVVNTLITAAWRTFSERRTDKAVVYNCTSGTLNPILWHDYGRITEKHALNYPSKYVTFYPGFSFRTNLFVHWFITLFYQILPACLFDFYFFCTGQRVYMYSLVLKFIEACKHGRFFATHGWKFHCGNMVALNKSLSTETSDAETFPVNIKLVEWDSYVKDYVVGLRCYALRDPLSTLPAARTKLQRIYWISTGVMSMFIGFSAYVAYRFLLPTV